MIGRRVYPDASGWLPPLEKGDYGKPNLSQEEAGYDGTDEAKSIDWMNTMNRWQICAPDGSQGSIATHKVIEHDDGTVTMTPSLDWSQRRPGGWHGFLERGIWRSC